jgi:phosphoglycerate dehydrogenase-like enzyme
VFREYDVRKVGFDELLRQSDYISLHMPLSEETKNLFSKPQFEAMKDTAYIINTLEVD